MEGVKVGTAEIIKLSSRCREKATVVERHLTSVKHENIVIRTELLICARLGSNHFLNFCILFNPYNKCIR